MKYGQLSCIESYSCYLQQRLSIELFSYWTPGCSQKGPMNKVCLSICPKVLLELAKFFLELSMMLVAHVVLCMTEPDFFKQYFCAQNGENRLSLGFFECIGKFSY